MKYALTILLLCATGSAICMNDNNDPQLTPATQNSIGKLSLSDMNVLAELAHNLISNLAERDNYITEEERKMCENPRRIAGAHQRASDSIRQALTDLMELDRLHQDQLSQHIIDGHGGGNHQDFSVFREREKCRQSIERKLQEISNNQTNQHGFENEL